MTVDRIEVDKKWNGCTNCHDKTYNTDADFCWSCGSNAYPKISTNTSLIKELNEIHFGSLR